MNFPIAFKLDDEFRQRNRPQTKQERLGLERLIEEEGCADGALTVGLIGDEKILVDGYNTLAICNEKGITPTQAKYLPFTSRQDALQWIDRRQRARRNLSPEEMAANRAERVERVAEARAEGKSIRTIAEVEGVAKSTIEDDIKEAGVRGRTPEPLKAKVQGKDGKIYAANKPQIRCARCERIKANNPHCPQCLEARGQKPKPLPTPPNFDDPSDFEDDPKPRRDAAHPTPPAPKKPAPGEKCPTCGCKVPAAIDALDFAEFWAAYPRKTNKPAAVRAWKKLKPSAATLALILTDIGKRKSSAEWLKEGGQFIPHPASYLNGERWNDDEGKQGKSKAEFKAQREYAISLGWYKPSSRVPYDPAVHTGPQK